MKTFYKKPAFAVIAAAMFVANFVGVSVSYADDAYFYCRASSATDKLAYVSDVLSTPYYRAYTLKRDFEEHVEDEYGVSLSNTSCHRLSTRESTENYRRKADDRFREEFEYSVTEIGEYEWDGK